VPQARFQLPKLADRVTAGQAGPACIKAAGGPVLVRRAFVFLHTEASANAFARQESPWSYKQRAGPAPKWNWVQTPCLSPRSTTANAGSAVSTVTSAPKAGGLAQGSAPFLFFSSTGSTDS